MLTFFIRGSSCGCVCTACFSYTCCRICPPWLLCRNCSFVTLPIGSPLPWRRSCVLLAVPGDGEVCVPVAQPWRAWAGPADSPRGQMATAAASVGPSASLRAAPVAVAQRQPEPVYWQGSSTPHPALEQMPGSARGSCGVSSLICFFQVK